MRDSAWRLLSSLGYAVGFIAFLLGLYAYLYYETNLIGSIGLEFQPYRNYAIPILVAGVALIIIVYLTESLFRKKQEASKNNNSQEKNQIQKKESNAKFYNMFYSTASSQPKHFWCPHVF